MLAASSLTNAFETLAKQFEAAYPGTKVILTFGESSALASEIAQGATADGFASDGPQAMQRVVDANANASTPTNFAANMLEIAVAPGNPKHIVRVADLANPTVGVVLCVRTVSCGQRARGVLVNAGIIVAPESLESNANATLTKVEQGKADAAIVDTSDVKSAGNTVDGVAIPDDVNAVTTLSIVALRDSKNSAVAQAWITFVLAHREELDTTFGFLPPP